MNTIDQNHPAGKAKPLHQNIPQGKSILGTSDSQASALSSGLNHNQSTSNYKKRDDSVLQNINDFTTYDYSYRKSKPEWRNERVKTKSASHVGHTQKTSEQDLPNFSSVLSPTNEDINDFFAEEKSDDGYSSLVKSPYFSEKTGLKTSPEDFMPSESDNCDVISEDEFFSCQGSITASDSYSYAAEETFSDQKSLQSMFQINKASPLEATVSLQRNISSPPGTTLSLQRNIASTSEAAVSLQKNIASPAEATLSLQRNISSTSGATISLQRNMASHPEAILSLQSNLANPPGATLSQQRNIASVSSAIPSLQMNMASLPNSIPSRQINTASTPNSVPSLQNNVTCPLNEIPVLQMYAISSTNAIPPLQTYVASLPNPSLSLQTIMANPLNAILPEQTNRTDCPNANSFISVYWDIENCPVPSKKSAIDIVKKIRDTFYGDRTEDQFIAVCDTTRLARRVYKELDEAFVHVMYTDSSNKNAADQKLQYFLRQFQYKHGRTNSAIVLISGDSDFSSFLCEMRYHHHVYIYLICKKSTRKSLQVAAHKYFIYEDFISDLPDRGKREDTEFYMLVSGLPAHVSSKILKRELESKIKSINGKVRKVSGTTAEIIFSNKGAADKARKLLEAVTIGRSKISISCHARSYESIQTARKKSLKESGQLNKSSLTKSVIGKTPPLEKSDVANQGTPAKQRKLDENQANRNTPKSFDAQNNSFRESNLKIQIPQVASENAAVKISVQHRTDDVAFWKKKLVGLLNTSEFSLQKVSCSCDGFFLINFTSTSKAQKAQEIIQKVQKANPLTPKFIKLIKNDITFSPSTKTPENNKVNIVAKKSK